MTDPTVPAPQQPEATPEPVQPRRRRRPSKRWTIVLIVGFVLALALGGAAYGVHAKGDAKAEEYQKAIDDWNDQKNQLLSAAASANSGLWERFDDPTKKKSLAKQKAACDEVLSLRDDAAKATADLPEAPDSTFKFLSSAHRDAIKTSEARMKAVNAYFKAADEVLVQMRRDCRWNIKLNSVKEDDSGAAKIYDKAEGMLLKPGRSLGNYYCPSSSKVSCLPVSQADRTRFAELILKALKTEKKFTMKTLFGSGSCKATSYRDLCVSLEANLTSYYANIGDYSAVFKQIDPSNAELKQEYEQMKKGNKSADKKFKKDLFKAHPDLKEDPDVSKFPFWREAYFNASAHEAVSNLNDLKQAVLKLQLPETVSV